MSEAKTPGPGGSGVEQWDLTPRVSPYLDRHMIFPLLEFLDTLIDEGKISKDLQSDVAAARLSLLRPTHMVDYAMDVYKSLHGNVPAEMEAQKEQVYKDLETLRQGCQPLDALCKNEEERTKLQAKDQWNLAGLANYDANMTADMVETYKRLARYNFDCGDYQTARDMLTRYIELFAKAPPPTVTDDGDAEDEELISAGVTAATTAQQASSSDRSKETGNPAMYYLTSMNENLLQVLWGRLACEIVVQDWEAASVAVEAVKTAMESMVSSHQMSALQALQQRTWLLHWSLFVYWNDSAKGGLEQLVDLFQSERYKQAITTNAPHLLRYLTAAVLLCKRRVTNKASSSSSNYAGSTSNAEAHRLLKNLIHVIQDCEYADPIVEFVNCLCIKFDFDSAQQKLAECEQVLATDFFLCHQTALFMEEARVFVFENYCRIHNKIDLKALGEKLAMNQDEAERWIVDLIIRNADLDAKIDIVGASGEENKEGEGCVIMGGSPQSIYEQVMDRTRDLNVRSATLGQNLNNLLNDARKEKAKSARAALD